MPKKELQFLPIIDFNSPHTGISTPGHVAESCTTCLTKRLAGEIMLGGSTAPTRALLGYAYVMDMVTIDSTDMILNLGLLSDPEDVKKLVTLYQEEALKHLHQALDIDPDNIFALGLVAMVHYRRQEYCIAHVCWRKIYRLRKDLADVYFNLGLAAAMDGVWNRAVPWFNGLLKLAPDFPRAREMLDLCEKHAAEEASTSPTEEDENGKQRRKEKGKWKEKEKEKDGEKENEKKKEGDFEWPVPIWLLPEKVGTGEPKRLKLAKKIPRCSERTKRHDPAFWEALLAQESMVDHVDSEGPTKDEHKKKKNENKGHKGKKK